MKKLKKYYKYIVIILTVIIVSILSILIYVNLFKEGVSDRLEGIENYKITKKEINSVKESLNQIESINKIEISTNYKIIKIFIQLSEDIKFNDISDVIDDSINSFSKKNLKFYDVEIFIHSLDEESEVYPKIGYKHKSDSEFTWNR